MSEDAMQDYQQNIFDDTSSTQSLPQRSYKKRQKEVYAQEIPYDEYMQKPAVYKDVAVDELIKRQNRIIADRMFDKTKYKNIVQTFQDLQKQFPAQERKGPTYNFVNDFNFDNIYDIWTQVASKKVKSDKQKIREDKLKALKGATIGQPDNYIAILDDFYGNNFKVKPSLANENYLASLKKRWLSQANKRGKSKYYANDDKNIRDARSKSTAVGVQLFIQDLPYVIRHLQNNFGLDIGVNSRTGAISALDQNYKTISIGGLVKAIKKIVKLFTRQMILDGKDPASNFMLEALKKQCLPLLKSLECFNNLAYQFRSYGNKNQYFATIQGFQEYQAKRRELNAKTAPIRTLRNYVMLVADDKDEIPSVLKYAAKEDVNKMATFIHNAKMKKIPEDVEKNLQRRAQQAVNQSYDVDKLIQNAQQRQEVNFNKVKEGLADSLALREKLLPEIKQITREEALQNLQRRAGEYQQFTSALAKQAQQNFKTREFFAKRKINDIKELQAAGFAQNAGSRVPIGAQAQFGSAILELKK